MLTAADQREGLDAGLPIPGAEFDRKLVMDCKALLKPAQVSPDHRVRARIDPAGVTCVKSVTSVKCARFQVW